VPTFEVEVTDQFGEWFDGLDDEQQEALTVRIELLAEQGPTLRRPTVGEIVGSTYDPKMKEIICNEGGALRVLFMFDPRQVAILLLGGDKAGNWKAWYRKAIPEADQLYAIYLNELKQEGLL
jgi:hypothetical protein